LALTEGNYKSWNKETNALGKYQYLWSHHGDKIKEITGVSSMEDFINSPESQEKYHTYNMEKNVIPTAEKYKKNYPIVNAPTEAFMGLIHFLGSGGAKIYLDELQRTKSYEAAQSAIDADIYKRTGGKPPKNMKVVDYLNKLLSSGN